MVTGLHTGDVPFRVELLDEPPQVPDGGNDGWEEVVEASVYFLHPTLSLWAFESGVEIVLPVKGPYRARYHARGIDAAHQSGGRRDGDPVIDRYLLQLWPGPIVADVVLRQTSEQAAYWHRVARESPAPR